MASETNLKTFANAIFTKVKVVTDSLSNVTDSLSGKISDLTTRVSKNETDISELPDKIKEIQTKSFAGGDMIARRRAGVVSLEISFATYSDYTKVTLPSGWRPYKDIPFAIIVGVSNKWYLGYARLKTDGTLTCRYYASYGAGTSAPVASASMVGYITYMANV